SLRSGLVSSRQWKEVAKEALRSATMDEQSADATKTNAVDVDSQPIHASACQRIADALIQRGLVTPYQSQQLIAGRTKLSLGNYRITDWLGEGGMGQVFAGVHEIMGRKCAIKVLPLEKATEVSRQGFMREIRLQATLDSPYLVRAFDAGRDGNVHYLVTELVEGTDLRQLVKKRGPLSMQAAASIIAQAAAGLAYAHESGLVHRDIKPANILVTHDGHAKVSDVGLAALTRLQHRHSVEHDSDDQHVLDEHGSKKPRQGTLPPLDLDDPRAGKIVGTADYLSPEQIRTPENIGPASDIYSLGCTLYFACTGKVPFPGGDTREKCRRHIEEAPWHPRQFSADISDEFADAIADMMEKEPERRIASASDVVARLSPWAAADLPDGEAIWPNDSGILQHSKSPAVSLPGQPDDRQSNHHRGFQGSPVESGLVVLDEPGQLGGSVSSDAASGNQTSLAPSTNNSHRSSRDDISNSNATALMPPDKSPPAPPMVSELNQQLPTRKNSVTLFWLTAIWIATAITMTAVGWWLAIWFGAT
ncbi:MAG: serine/threonine-protein kinase, partial [Planctomycetota bacterium]